MNMRSIPKINYVGPYFYEKDIPMRVYDFNIGQHLSNDVVLKIVLESHRLFLAAYGMDLNNILNTSMIFAGTTINFLKEIHYKQLSESLCIRVKLALYQTTKSRICFYHEHVYQQNICHKALVDVAYIDNVMGKIAKTDDIIEFYQSKTF